MSTDAAVKDAQPLDDSPAGLQKRWTLELQAAHDFVESFHEDGDRAVQEFLGKGDGKGKRLNLFHSDVATKSATLSGVPKVRAKRRFADAKDDIARVSAQVLERILNTDIERESDGFRKALKNAKSDWLKPGLGVVRLRYVVETEPVLGDDQQPLVIDGTPQERKKFEDVETDYVKWKRFRWSPAEVWDDVRWIAYGLDLSKEEWEKQFPGRAFYPKARDDKDKAQRDEFREVFGRAEVWEIWDKTSRQTLFLCDSHQTILKVVPDKLGLPGFFPSPEPLMSNVTTSKCIPRPSFFLAKDLYDEANELEVRIRKLVKMARVSGAYDASNAGLQNILDDAYDGKLVPVQNWSSLVDKGGLAGSVSFLPIKDIVETILALSNRLAMLKQEIYEITGQSDLMRGQQTQRETATTSRIKARFGSTRIQSEQDEFARFASQAQQIRAFIIAKHFDPETLAKRSNLENTDDAQFLGPAIDMLKSGFSDYRVEVDSDSLSMTDFDAVQQERTTAVQALGGLLTASMPLMQGGGPKAIEFVLEMGSWLLAGTRGSEGMESVFDRFRAEAKQAAAQPPAPPPPDPKLEAEKVKAGAAQFKAKADVAKVQLDVQAAQAKHGMEMQKMQGQAAMDAQRLRGDMMRAATEPPEMESDDAR